MTIEWDGRPRERAEEDGWHFLRVETGRLMIRAWCAETGIWDGCFTPSDYSGWGYSYEGPCLTPTEVATLVREAGKVINDLLVLSDDGFNCVDRALLWLIEHDQPDLFLTVSVRDRMDKTRAELARRRAEESR